MPAVRPISRDTPMGQRIIDAWEDWAGCAAVRPARRRLLGTRVGTGTKGAQNHRDRRDQ